ncbi:MAG: c-type cytochrome [Rhodanobacteraceae bacterium]
MKVRIAVLACAVLALTGCERGMHEMYNQPKYKPLTPSPLFADGNASRRQVPGTVPRSAGALAGTSSGRLGRVTDAHAAGPVTGVDAQGKPLAQGGPGAQAGYSNPLPITPQLLRRGQQRFDIYCAPCHSRAGDGDGMIARRGFPHPPSYHTDALRNAPDSHFYDVITDGYGAMFAYADRVSPHDRWAIVAYIRALQLSQHAPASELSREDWEKLNGGAARALNPSPPARGAGVRVRYAAEPAGAAESSPAPSCVPAKGSSQTCTRWAQRPGHPLPKGEGKKPGAMQ